jgi:osmoprotectant transport system permease protein
VTTILSTIPSLAVFSLLLPLYGLSATLVVAGLVRYSLTLLVRSILAGLRAVPEDTRQAASPWCRSARSTWRGRVCRTGAF